MSGRRGNKYGAVRTTVDNVTFASKREAERYRELKLLRDAGQIHSLALQPRFPLRVLLTGGNGFTVANLPEDQPVRVWPAIGSYVGDFSYIECATGRLVVEDVKGMDTPLSKWKRKHAAAQYGVEITVIR